MFLDILGLGLSPICSSLLEFNIGPWPVEDFGSSTDLGDEDELDAVGTSRTVDCKLMESWLTALSDRKPGIWSYITKAKQESLKFQTFYKWETG